MDCPTSLKSVKPYLDRASEVQAKDPIVAYHCRLYALQEAMALRAKLPKADMGFVLTLMDELEAEKGALGDLDSASAQVENFAQDLFQRADDADRAGQSDLRTAKVYLAAANVMEACKQFGELPADLSEKIKYAKWRFVELAKAVKERRAPAPPRGMDEGGGGPAVVAAALALVLAVVALERARRARPDRPRRRGGGHGHQRRRTQGLLCDRRAHGAGDAAGEAQPHGAAVRRLLGRRWGAGPRESGVSASPRCARRWSWRVRAGARRSWRSSRRSGSRARRQGSRPWKRRPSTSPRRLRRPSRWRRRSSPFARRRRGTRDR